MTVPARRYDRNKLRAYWQAASMTVSLRGVAWTAFAAAVALLVGCSIYLLRATNRFSAGEALVSHTREVQILVENMGAEVFQSSNAAEAFVLTGDQAMLARYNTAIAKIPGDISRLRSRGGAPLYRQPKPEDLPRLRFRLCKLQRLHPIGRVARNAPAAYVATVPEKIV